MRRTSSLLLIVSSLLISSAFGKEKYVHPGPIRLDRDGEKWAQKTLRKMSPEEKVGQLFMIWVRARFLNLDSPDYNDLRDTMRRDHIGSFAMTVPVDGPFLIKSEPYEAAMLLSQLQRDSKLPLLIAADFERGVSMRLYGTTVFPHAMAFGAAGKAEYAEASGRITAEEARAIGVHWNFFPDADVNSNPANPIINTRSYGEDPQQVGDLAAAYIRGAHAGGMLTTAKHFPGHGDTATDTHLGVAQVTGDMARLQSVELPPFRKAIEAGVDSVMVAHVSIPALEPDPNRVATVSPTIVSNLLQGQLGFKGLIVTDALDMAALTRLYASNIGRAAVDAFKAGSDLLLIPADLEASYKAMVEAVKSGEISSERVDASVLKILKLKASLGLHKARVVDVDAISRSVGKPANLEQGQRTADDAITLVKDNGKAMPLKATGTVEGGLPYQKVEEVNNRLVLIIFSDDMRTESGRALERQMRTRVPDVHVMYVDSRTAAAMSEEVLRIAGEAQTVVAAVYVIPTAGKAIQGAGGLTNTVALADATGALLNGILEHAADKTVVVAMGNPYVAADFPAIANYMCTFSNATVSEVSAAK
ncbi:MAG TPA: glycoside hydrolase family 3 N-terminal domain-containing protein, partial [Terriglobales bacterium]